MIYRIALKARFNTHVHTHRQSRKLFLKARTCSHFCLERPHLGSQPQARWPAVTRRLRHACGWRLRSQLRELRPLPRPVPGHRSRCSRPFVAGEPGCRRQALVSWVLFEGALVASVTRWPLRGREKPGLPRLLSIDSWARLGGVRCVACQAELCRAHQLLDAPAGPRGLCGFCLSGLLSTIFVVVKWQAKTEICGHTTVHSNIRTYMSTSM